MPVDNITLYAGTSSSNDFDNFVQMRHVVSSVVKRDWVNSATNVIASHDIALLKVTAAITEKR